MTSIWRQLLSQSWWVKGCALAATIFLPVLAATAFIVLSSEGDSAPDDERLIAAVSPSARRTPTPLSVTTPIPLPETPIPTAPAIPSSTRTPSQLATQPPAQGQSTAPPPPTAAPTAQPTAQPTPVPAPTIDVAAVCEGDATTVGDRVYSLYYAKGYTKTTYEGLANEADSVYYDFCVQSSTAAVDLYDFCYGVEAWRYFFDQQAGAQEWLDDCFAHKFF